MYLYPLQLSPFSRFASATLANFPFLARSVLSSFTPSMISSRSPRSLLAFSCLSRKRKRIEHINPIPIYISTIPCPRVYHGLSRARYYDVHQSAILFLHCNHDPNSTHNIRADSSIDVAEADHHGQCDATLVGAFDIVRDPRDGVRNVGINPTRSQIYTEV